MNASQTPKKPAIAHFSGSLAHGIVYTDNGNFIIEADKMYQPEPAGHTHIAMCMQGSVGVIQEMEAGEFPFQAVYDKLQEAVKKEREEFMKRFRKERDIIIITADAVKDTGTISFMFMIHADPERKIHPMPQKYGYVWRTNPGCYSFNVFEGGKGLYVDGGWTGEDSNEWAQKMADAIPSCTLLMDIDHMPWWKELAEKHDIVFRHHHFAGILKTSY